MSVAMNHPDIQGEKGNEMMLDALFTQICKDTTIRRQAAYIFECGIHYPPIVFANLCTPNVIFQHWRHILAEMELFPSIYKPTLDMLCWENPIWLDFIAPYREAVGLHVCH